MIPDTISALEYEPVQLALPVAAEQVLPDFVEVPQDVKITEGDKAVLTVRVIGQPTPNVVWYIDDEPIHSDERISLESEGEKYQLIINEAVLDDEGMYKCVAKSEAGKAICEVELLVEGMFCEKNKTVFFSSYTIINVQWNSGIKRANQGTGKVCSQCCVFRS